MRDYRLTDLLIKRFFSGEASDEESEQVLDCLNWSHEAFNQLLDYGKSRGALFDLTPEMHGQAYRDTKAWVALSRATATSSIEGATSWKERLQEWLSRFDEFAVGWTRQLISEGVRSGTQASEREQLVSLRLPPGETRIRFTAAARLPTFEVALAEEPESPRPLLLLVREDREEMPMISEVTEIRAGKFGARFNDLEPASYLLMVEPTALRRS